MNKNGIVLITVACIVLVLLSSLCVNYLENRLIILSDETAIASSSSYWNMTAVIAQDGNCYIRGDMVSSTSPYGIDDVKQYNKRYQSLNINKANDFVQIYDKADAISVNLSDNGGTIITSDHDLYIFTGNENYKTPQFFCKGIVYAKLVEDRVYVLSSGRVFGYYNIADPELFFAIKTDVVAAKVTDMDQSIWLLMQNKQLLVGTKAVQNDWLCCAVDVDAFDVLTVESLPRNTHAQYSVGYVSNGQVFYYNGHGIPQSDLDGHWKLIAEDATDVTAYSEGIIWLNAEKQVFIYGRDYLSDDFFNGEILGRGVVDVSAGLFNITIAMENKPPVYVGTLPSSETVYINEINKTGDGSLS